MYPLRRSWLPHCAPCCPYCCALDECLSHSLRYSVHHLVFMLCLHQCLEGWEVKLLDHITRPSHAVWLKAFMLVSFNSFMILFLLIFFELVLLDRDIVDVVYFTDYCHVEASVPPGVPKDVLTQKSTHWNSRASVRRVTESVTSRKIH